MGRGLIIALIASLAANLFAVGFISGRLISDEPRSPHAERGGPGRIDNPLGLMNHARDLQPEMREAFRDKIRAKLPALREQHRLTHKLRQELAMLIKAEEWDRGAITAKLDEIKTAQDRQREVFNAAFIDAFETLPPEERRRLIEVAANRHKDRGALRERRRHDWQ